MKIHWKKLNKDSPNNFVCNYYEQYTINAYIPVGLLAEFLNSMTPRNKELYKKHMTCEMSNRIRVNNRIELEKTIQKK